MEISQTIPEVQFTAENVEQAILQLHSHTVPDHQVHVFLQQAQSSPSAWTFCWHLLHQDKPVEVQFFGASCLYAKLSKDGQELKGKQYKEMRELLVVKTVQLACSAKFVVNKLCQVVAAFAIQHKATSKDAPDPVQSVFSFYDTVQQDNPQFKITDVHHVILGSLTMLPEEYGCSHLSQPARSAVFAELQKGVPEVMQRLRLLLSQRPEVDAQCRQQVFTCFEKWCRFDIEPDDLLAVMENMVCALRHKDTADVAGDVLVKIFQGSKLDRRPKVLLKTLEIMNGLRDLIVNALRTQDLDTVRSLCCVLTAVGENNVTELCTLLLSGGEGRQTVIAFLQNIMEVGFPPGQYLVDEDISNMSINFWCLLQDAMQSLDERNNDQEVVQLFQHMYKTVMGVLLSKVQFPDEAVFSHWDQGTHDEFMNYRQQTQDLMRSCYEVLGESLLQDLYESLQSLVNASNIQQSVKWQELEAILVALGVMGQVGNLSDCHYLPLIMKLLPSIPFHNPLLLSSAVFMIGTFHEWLAGQPDILHEVFPLVLEGVRHQQSALHATTTLQSFISHTLQAMQPFIPQILAASQELFGLGELGESERLRLMECVGQVLSTLSTLHIEHYLNTVLLSPLQLMQHLVSQAKTEDVQTKLMFQMKLLSQLLGALNTAQPEGREGEGETMEGVEAARPNLVYEVLKMVFPVLQDMVHQWKTQPALVQVVSEMFQKSLRVLGKDFRPMADEVANMMLEMYKTTPHESILNLAQDIVFKFQTDATFSSYTRLLVQVFCATTLHDFHRISEDPSVLEAYNRFMANMVKKSRDVLLSSSVSLDEVLTAGILTMRAPLQSSVDSGCLLVTEFLQVSRVEESVKILAVNHMPSIAATVMEVILSQPGEEKMVLMTEVLRCCCACLLQAFSAAMRDCLSRDVSTPHLTAQDKTTFLQLLIRNQKDMRTCRKLVNEFALKYHGTHIT